MARSNKKPCKDFRPRTRSFPLEKKQIGRDALFPDSCGTLGALGDCGCRRPLFIFFPSKQGPSFEAIDPKNSWRAKKKKKDQPLTLFCY